MKTLKVGLTLALVAAITGCDKSEKAEPSAPAATHQAHLRIADGSNDWREAANPDNPNDQVGLEHNRCLASIVDQVTYEGLRDPQQVYEAAFHYGAGHYDAAQVDAWRAGFSPDQLSAIYAKLENGIPDEEYVLGLSGLDGNARDYLRGLLDQVYTPDACQLSNDELKEMVMHWEAGIRSADVDEHDRSILYAVGSSYRYSMYAWTDAQFPADGDGHVELRRLRLFGIIATFVFDSVGSAVGPIGTAAMSAGCMAICAYNNW